MTPMASRVAAHEVGHAVAAYLAGARIDYMTALRSARGAGAVQWGRDTGCDRCDPIYAAVIALAGGAAEALYAGDDDDDAVIRRASAVDRKRARAAIAECAHSWAEVAALEAWLRVRARELVRTPRFAHLAEALLPVLIERGELDGETARAVLLEADRLDIDLLTERTAA